jgi:hypothetical protein
VPGHLHTICPFFLSPHPTLYHAADATLCPLPLSSGALNDYQKDLQFRKLNAQKDVIDVKAVRSGKTVLIKNNDIVVGDVLVLDTGGWRHKQLMGAVFRKLCFFWLQAHGLSTWCQWTVLL